KLMRVTAAPQITAAAQDTRTPILPREARWGLELLEPKPHTIALISSARTDRMRATVITAPTMVRSAAIPGSPESFGVTSTSIGSTDVRVGTSSSSADMRKPPDRVRPATVAGSIGQVGAATGNPLLEGASEV